MNEEIMVEVRYNLLEIVGTAIKYDLTSEELLSAIFSECNFEETTPKQYLLSNIIINQQRGRR